MRGGVVWVLQAGMKGPGLPSNLSRYEKLRVIWAKFLRKIQFPRGLCCRLNHKLATRTLFGERIATCARPVFAAKRNGGKLPCATGTEITVTCVPGLRLVFLRGWCVSAKLVADGNANGLSDTDALLIGVRVLT